MPSSQNLPPLWWQFEVGSGGTPPTPVCLLGNTIGEAIGATTGNGIGLTKCPIVGYLGDTNGNAISATDLQLIQLAI